MVRTATNKNRVTGGKAPRKRVPARPGAVVPKLPKKRQSIGTYRRCAQPIPEWQKSIAEFCIPIDIQSSSFCPTMPSTNDEQPGNSILMPVANDEQDISVLPMPVANDEQVISFLPMLDGNDEQPSSLSSARPVADDIETDSPSSTLSENVNVSYDESSFEKGYASMYVNYEMELEETEDKENEVVVKGLDDLEPCQVAMKPADYDPFKTGVIMKPHMYKILEKFEKYANS